MTRFIFAQSLCWISEGRKVLVLITDGGDTTSKADYNNAFAPGAAGGGDCLHYYCLCQWRRMPACNLGGRRTAHQISKDTGGKYYYAEGEQQLDEAFRKISDELPEPSTCWPLHHPSTQAFRFTFPAYH